MRRAGDRRRALARATPGVSVVVALALVGCLDLESLRERGASDSTGCVGEPTDLRLWKLHLGQSDYLTLKNPSACAIELGGLNVLFDDHSDLFPDDEVDCLVALPTSTLQAGVEVRVHEDPLEGDIGAVANLLSGCAEDLSFNPSRGGVVYLCDGRCEEARVFDAVAFAGEERGPPPMRYFQEFDEPLQGVSIANQESARFRRVATEGVAPNFVAADWELETRYLYAGFEDGVELELEGERMAWSPEAGQAAIPTTTSEVAIGVASLSLTQTGGDGRSQGLTVELAALQSTPTHVSYFTRMDMLPASGAYFDLQHADFSLVRAGFEGRSLGTEIENDERTEVEVAQGDLHQVELRNIDWPAKTYDLYVNRELVGAGLPFWTNAFSVDRLSLYNAGGGATAGWDEIELWR